MRGAGARIATLPHLAPRDNENGQRLHVLCDLQGTEPLTSMCALQAASLAVTILVLGLYKKSGSSRRPLHKRNFLRALSLLLIRCPLLG